MTGTSGRWRCAILGLLAALSAAGCGGGSEKKQPAWKPGDPVTVDVSSSFQPGTTLRDAYGGATVTVAADGKVTVTPGAEGLVLLERDGATPTPFRWDAATIYFVLTDRFHNGDPSNDGSYGRQQDGADEVGTWHGGDLAGLTAKLDYIAGLGVDAIWISPPVEQVHGWVSGGGGAFKHYGYAGYWALDFTRLDANLGTEAELRTFVDAAHDRGIRVLFDVVMNHPGYATGADMYAYFPEVFEDGTGDAWLAYEASSHADYDTFYDLVVYQGGDWSGWWGREWVRAGLGDYSTGDPNNDLTRGLAFLPDFITEAPAPVARPALFGPGRKTDTGVVDLPDATVRDYLVAWHARWVRDFGIDGFRCDTVKHVETASWAALKDAASDALADWKAANPGKALDDLPFWTVGEVFPHGVEKDTYYTAAGFDSLLNFDFWPRARGLAQRPSLGEAATELEALYSDYAAKLADPAFDATSYLSSHDTALAYAELGGDAARQRDLGTVLLLSPGSVQVFYGDESGRELGPTGNDTQAGTRSDMNWDSTAPDILAHWQKVGTFRRRHAAVGAGAHARLASPAGTYAFTRRLDAGDDAVVVVITRRP